MTFFTTHTTKHPMIDYAPHLETGTKLAYGLKVYRCQATVQNTSAIYDVTDCETGQAIWMPPGTAVVAATLKAKEGTLTNITNFSLFLRNPVGDINTNYAFLYPLADVNLGCGTTYGQIAGAVSTVPTNTITNRYSTVRLVTLGGTNSTLSNVVYITLLVMETMP